MNHCIVEDFFSRRRSKCMGYDTNNKMPKFGNKTALSRYDCHQLPEAPPPPDEPPPPEKLELLEKLDLLDPPELPDETVNPPMEARPLALNPSSIFLTSADFASSTLAMGKTTRYIPSR